MKKLVMAILAFATLNMFAADLDLWKNSTLNKIVQSG